MAEVITDPKLRKFVHSPVSTEFGLTIAQVANKCKNFGRFSSWLNGNITLITEVLNKVKENGVSPAFFAAYEVTEGYNSKWGWLNHTTVNGSPVTDADSVSKWVATQSKNTTDKPAWIDFANYKDFVPDSVKTAGNADFANMTLGSIGKVVIAGTAAATWEVYYPNGLLKEYNGVQNYGAPINHMMNTIVNTWAGSLDDVDPDPNAPDPPDDEEHRHEEPNYDFGFLTDKLEALSDALFKLLNDTLTTDLYDYGNKKSFGNSFLALTTQMDNMYKIKPTLNFKNVFSDLFNKAVNDMKKAIDDMSPIETDPQPVPDPDPSDPDPDDDPNNPIDGKPFYPTVSKAYLTSPWGPRWGRWHDGIDLGVGNVGGGNPPIYATQDGTVIANYWHDLSGWVVRIKHSKDPYFSGYQHLKGKSPIAVGTVVTKGTTLGAMGATGAGVTGIHLHFQIAKHNTGWYTQAGTIDPEKYLKMTF